MTKEEQWARDRFQPWCPEEERDAYLKDLQAAIRPRGGPRAEADGDRAAPNMARPSMEKLRDAIRRDNRRLRELGSAQERTKRMVESRT